MPPCFQLIKSISNPIPTVTGASVNFFIAGKISIIWIGTEVAMILLDQQPQPGSI
jgi:hypothetical protein